MRKIMSGADMRNTGVRVVYTGKARPRAAGERGRSLTETSCIDARRLDACASLRIRREGDKIYRSCE